MLNIFRCFLAIQESSIVKSKFRSIHHFLIGLFGCLVVSFLSSLCRLAISPISDVRLVKIFSQSVGCQFVLLTMTFALQKTSGYMRSHLSFLDSRA